jgi:hypothetical protein
MYLVADDAHMVAVADVCHALEFLASPDTARRIVRVAEQEDGAFVVGALSLEVLPVYLEARVQHGFRYFATIIADGGEKAVVVRREDEHLFAWHGEGFDGY